MCWCTTLKIANMVSQCGFSVCTMSTSHYHTCLPDGPFMAMLLILVFNSPDEWYSEKNCTALQSNRSIEQDILLESFEVQQGYLSVSVDIRLERLKIQDSRRLKKTQDDSKRRKKTQEDSRRFLCDPCKHYYSYPLTIVKDPLPPYSMSK